jgi:hypothetical protein
MLHVAIVDSIMKDEDAQRMGKTVDRVGKRTILGQCVEQETNCYMLDRTFRIIFFITAIILIRIFTEAVFNSFSNNPSIFLRNHTSFILLNTQKTVKIHLGNVEMKVEPDSGADVNLMDEFHFTNLRKLSRNKLKSEKSKVELSTLRGFHASKISVISVFLFSVT